MHCRAPRGPDRHPSDVARPRMYGQLSGSVSVLKEKNIRLQG